MTWADRWLDERVAERITADVDARITRELERAADRQKLAAAIAPGIRAAVARFDKVLAAAMTRVESERLDADHGLPIGTLAALALATLDDRTVASAYIALPHALPGLELLTDDAYRRAVVGPLLAPGPGGPRCAYVTTTPAAVTADGRLAAQAFLWCLLPAHHLGPCGHAQVVDAAMSASYLGAVLNVDDAGEGIGLANDLEGRPFDVDDRILGPIRV